MLVTFAIILTAKSVGKNHNGKFAGTEPQYRRLANWSFRKTEKLKLFINIKLTV